MDSFKISRMLLYNRFQKNIIPNIFFPSYETILIQKQYIQNQAHILYNLIFKDFSWFTFKIDSSVRK